MSLLLEALRKAEKQSLLERAVAAPQAYRAAAAASGFTAADSSAAIAPARVKARESEPSASNRDSPPLALELEVEPERTSPALHESPPTRVLDEARPRGTRPRGIAEIASTARHLSPFYAVVGFLTSIAAVAIGYYWHQMQPAPPLVNSGALPQRPDGVLQVSQPHRAKLEIPGLPVAAPAPMTAPAPVAGRDSPAITTRPPTRSAQKLAVTVPNVAAGEVSPQRRAVTQIHPQVAMGYAALRDGNLDAAYAAYRQALQEAPDNADAMLGMAALEAHAGRHDLAEAHYLKLLQNLPHHPYAQAGLLALRRERVHPRQAETSLRALLAADPDAIPLNFSLGNQLARQGRWAEAQQAYLRALTRDPDNPDIAFNLAVSLDRLREPVQAMTYYERALALAAHRVASFPPAAARLRLEQLAP